MDDPPARTEEHPATDFLSDAWFAALGRAVETASLDCGDRSLVLGQVITGAPPGGSTGAEPVTYLVRLGTDRPGVVRDTLDDAEVTLVLPHRAASALASGEVSTGRLLESGELKLRGDARRLIEEADLLAAVGAAMRGAPHAGQRDSRTVT